MSQYEPPVDRLLTLGESLVAEDDWPDYVSLGITGEHVAALVRMAIDKRLLDDARSPAAWAPEHALRALAQLGTPESLDALVSLIDAYELDEMGAENLRLTFAVLGARALAPLQGYLGRPEAEVYRRGLAAETIAEIGLRHPDTRDASVAALAQALERFAAQPREVNAFVVASLMDLDAVEAMGVIERAFAADAVDIEIPGDWEDVQLHMGLIAARTTPRPRYGPWLDDLALPGPARRVRDAERKRAAKAKRKQAAASRRRNRRRR
jgi:hypothetical protein